MAAGAGSVREVYVCAACKERAVAGQKPQVRMVEQWSDNLRPYWMVGEEMAAYIDGYWSQGDGRHWWFPDDDARGLRTGCGLAGTLVAPVPGSGHWSSDVGQLGQQLVVVLERLWQRFGQRRLVEWQFDGDGPGRPGPAPAVEARPAARHGVQAAPAVSRTTGRSSLCRTASDVTARVRQT